MPDSVAVNTLAGIIPVRRYFVAAFPLSPLMVKSPATKGPMLVHGSLPGPTYSGVRAAIRLSGTKAFTAIIRLSMAHARSASTNVFIARVVFSDGAAPPLTPTRVTQFDTTRTRGVACDSIELPALSPQAFVEDTT